MKIACITFHNSSNYGAVLQTYALKEYMTSLGHEYQIINYSNPEKLKFDSIFGRNKDLNFGGYLYKLISFPYNAYVKKKFILFSNKYLNITRMYHTHEELKTLNGEYDYFICGSDQVWNASMVRYDSAYFLSFVYNKAQKFSYAASFGKNTIAEKDVNFYSKMLSEIDRISVREKSGLNIVKKCSNKEAQVVLDPTLLLTSNQWGEIAVIPNVSKPYILAYVLRHDKVVQSFLDKLKKQTGMKVIYISRGFVSMLRDGATAIPSPEEWVGLFLNASYVVTTSFHGTAFSVNFNKPFFSFIQGDVNTDTNSRIVDFLESVELDNRIYTNSSDEKIDLIVPNFEKANKKLAKYRNESKQYIKDSLLDI